MLNHFDDADIWHRLSKMV